jgi:Transcriptional regulators
MGFDQIRQRRLSDDIVEQLEGMILEGTLKAGERLPAERALAEQFGVSRPSLREAIQKLAAKGLLVSRQGGGNYVVESLGTTSAIRCCICWKATLKRSAICWNFVTPWKPPAPITQPCVLRTLIASD